MKRLTAIVLLALVTLIGSTFVLPSTQPVEAQAGVNVCDFIRPICDAIFGEGNNPGSDAGADAQDYVSQRVGLILSLVFVGIVLISVFVIIQASIKYIQSQGNEEKIADATKAIKSVFIGIGALFVGVLGIVLVAAFFNGINIFGSGGTGSGSEEQGNCAIVDGRLRCGDLE